MCVLHSIRFTCGQLHRVADIPLVEVKVKSEEWKICFRCSRRLLFLMIHCPLFFSTLQRYNIFRAPPNFRSPIEAIFSTKSLNWCFQYRACLRSAEFMRAWLCTRLIAALKQTVARACLACYRRDARISRPRFRKNRAPKITFAAFRAHLLCHNVIM